MHRLDDTDLAAYLARLGVPRRPPSADALRELHRAHVARIPYETAWLHLGEQRGIDQPGSVREIAHRGRGGYCFHLNGAFAALLATLGYDVTMHLGGVHGDEPGPVGNHMVLLVHGLPTDGHRAGEWYVDAGLGDALVDPIPLRPTTTTHEPFTFELRPSPAAQTDWQFVHDPRGSFTGMVFRAEPTGIDAFAGDHHHLSTSPESGFVRTMTAQRREPGRVIVMRARTLDLVDGEGTQRTVLDRDDWFATLQNTIGVDLSDVDRAGRDRLWAAVSGQHETHLARGG